MKRLSWIVIVGVVPIMIACGDMSYGQRNAMTGAAVGAAGGAGIAAISGGDVWTGALIGGAAGGVAGTMRGGGGHRW
jgi:osmotically inducible lipoprotein OsmB